MTHRLGISALMGVGFPGIDFDGLFQYQEPGSTEAAIGGSRIIAVPLVGIQVNLSVSFPGMTTVLTWGILDLARPESGGAVDGSLVRLTIGLGGFTPGTVLSPGGFTLMRCNQAVVGTPEIFLKFAGATTPRLVRLFAAGN